VSYAREFLGEKAAFVAGWMYFLNWAMTGIVDTTAIAQYCRYWNIFQVIPQWVLALIALIVVLSMNLISVKLFGELEFWAALVKVLALITFLIVGTIFLAGRFKVDGHDTGPSLWSGHGGLFPTGLLSLVLVTSGVVFAYAAIELVGIAAGETAEPEKIMPRAINSVVFRIAVFYIGSTVLLGMLLPFTAYKDGVSPFVTFFDKLGISWGDDLMNLVVLTAALSSLNAGLYSTGRILRSMSMAGSGPKFTGVMSKNGVPYGGILLTAGIGLFGIGLNAFTPKHAFEIVLHIAATGVIVAWATIVACQLRFHHLTQAGQLHGLADGVGDGGFAQVSRRRQRVSGHELFRWQVVRIRYARPVEQVGVCSAYRISGAGILGVDADQREIAFGQGDRGSGVNVHP